MRKRELLLTLAALYMGLLGIGFILLPELIGIGSVPEHPSPALLAYLRILGSPFLGISALDWMSRRLPVTPALRGIFVANIIGFGVAGLLDVWGMFNGARELAKLFMVVHLGFAAAFVLVARKTFST